MNTKNFKLFASVFALVFLIGFVSASTFVTFNNVSLGNISHDSSQLGTILINNINLTNNFTINAVNLTSGLNLLASNLSIISNGSNSISYSFTAPFNAGSYNYLFNVSNFSGDIYTLGSISFNVTPVPSISVSQLGLSKSSNGTVTIKNIGNIPLTNVNLNSLGNAKFTATFNQSSFGTLAVNQTVQAYINSTNTDSLKIGDDNSLTINVSSDQISNTTSVVVSEDICKFVNLDNDLSLDIKDVSIESGFGNSDEFWYPFDNVSIEVKVSNDGDSDIKSIDMKFCLLDETTGKCVLTESDVDISKNSFGLKNGKDLTTVLTFQVPSDVVDSSGDSFKFYVGASGKIDDSSSNYNKNETCVSENQDIDIRTNEQFVILSNFDYSNLATCGTNLPISGKAWNIDNGDASGVSIKVENSELGINKLIDLGDINSYDSTDFILSLDLPTNVANKIYALRLTVYDNGEVFENDENDKAIFTLPITLSGCTGFQTGVKIGATLTSSAKVGDVMTIQTIITNPGNMSSFTIVPSGYDSWAQLVGVDPQILSVNAAGSNNATITLKPTKTGTQSFTISVISNGQTTTQVVSVNVAESNNIFSSLNSLGIVGITLLIAIAVIILLIIIVMIVKLSSKPRHSEF